MNLGHTINRLKREIMLCFSNVDLLQKTLSDWYLREDIFHIQKVVINEVKYEICVRASLDLRRVPMEHNYWSILLEIDSIKQEFYEDEGDDYARKKHEIKLSSVIYDPEKYKDFHKVINYLLEEIN